MMKYTKTVFFALLLLVAQNVGLAQEKSADEAIIKQSEKLRLVVGIVVDQMRYDYLPLYWDKFEEGGFKRLVNKGFNFRNNHYNYFPTYTGPGHAAVYTGTTPSVNGIVGNSWYDRSIDDDMYVVSDSTVTPIGTDSEAGKMSPANLMSTTVTDELKNANEQSKVVAVSIKDRGAVLPGGHLADGAYWYEDTSGKFITSSWYKDSLPKWVQEFNEAGLAKELSKKTWKTLLPIEEYTESNADDTPYEGAFGKEDKPVFPHVLGDYTDENSYGIVKASPFGNTLVKELAKRTLDGEQLGTDGVTDFLSVSFSSTDYVGHQFGPHSVELQDTYLRLDRDLADLFNYLDQKVGKGQYLVMLTSDHGVVDVPAELMAKKLPGGYFNSEAVMELLDRHLHNTYGKGNWVEDYTNQQVYLDRDLIAQKEIALKEVQNEVATFLQQFKAVKSTNTAYNFQNRDYTDLYQSMYQQGFLYERSGDVYIQLKPGWLDTSYHTGTSHGSPYNYDTHVPLIFYGWEIPHGVSTEKTVIPQIAPTISSILNIGFPSGSPADVLEFEE